MDDFQSERNDILNASCDRVDELADVYKWNEHKTWRQAWAHLRGYALAYVKWAPFQLYMWDELRVLLLKLFQPGYMTATYKVEFRSRLHHQTEYIHAFVEALQCLADMDWAFMDALAEEKMVVDQFLMRMDSHKLNVHGIWTLLHGHCCIADVLQVAYLVEAMHEEEKHYSHGCNVFPLRAWSLSGVISGKYNK